jgi:hypothetical protein
MEAHRVFRFESASEKNEYQESTCVCKELPARKADILTAISESIM